jgi:hypothetical protein
MAIETTRNFLRRAFLFARGIRGTGATTVLALGRFYTVGGLTVFTERTEDNFGALVIGSGSVSTAQFSVITGLYLLVYVGGAQLCWQRQLHWQQQVFCAWLNMGMNMGKGITVACGLLRFVRERAFSSCSISFKRAIPYSSLTSLLAILRSLSLSCCRFSQDFNYKSSDSFSRARM